MGDGTVVGECGTLLVAVGSLTTQASQSLAEEHNQQIEAIFTESLHSRYVLKEFFAILSCWNYPMLSGENDHGAGTVQTRNTRYRLGRNTSARPWQGLASSA
jgi:hypothetical protein